jgi:endoribonuclease Dicer
VSEQETKRNKRENLDQKQILVPELCAIHPFSASLWRQAVALPCIMYRLNGLLIADQIRTAVAVEMRLGRPVLPPSADDDSPVWPALNFGWTLADVVNNTASRLNTDAKAGAGLAKVEDRGGGVGSVPAAGARDGGHEADEESGGEEEEWNSWEEGREGEDMGRMAHRLMSKLAAEERLNKKKKLGRTASLFFMLP